MDMQNCTQTLSSSFQQNTFFLQETLIVVFNLKNRRIFNADS